jgi:CRP/FNR family nitrogen fixation transcriptional regulator
MIACQIRETIMVPGDLREAPRFSTTPTLAGLPVGLPADFRTLPSFAPGAEIYAQDARNDGLYRIEFGAVRVHRLLADGRRQIAAFHLAGEVFGFEADATRHFFAEALCTTRLGVLRTGERQDVFAAGLLPVALQHLGRVQEHLLVLGRQSAIERVAAFLVDMSERQGGLPAIDLPMSRTDIADYLSLTIETVSRAFTRLRKTGVVRLPGPRHVEVVREPALRALASCGGNA